MSKIRVNAVCLIVFSCSWFIGCGLDKKPLAAADNVKERVVKTGKSSIVQKLKENDQLTIEERIALYHQLKKDSPNEYNFKNEDELTMYGYGFLWNNQIPEAIAIFKLIVSEFPNSSNPYDSLAEGYLADDNKELALLNYEKSLALNPENFNAEDQIERIKHPEIKPLTPAEKFAKVFTPAAYKEDLEQLGKKLTEIHPNALKFISKADFWKIIEEKKALITANTTYGEFAWHCSEIIASVNCSHSSMGSFYPENDMLPLSLRFPLQTRWVNDQLFVVDPLNNQSKVAIKDEILSINGIDVASLIKDIYKHISSQGYIETTKKHFFNTWSTGLIPFALGFPATYEIVVKGVDHPIVLNKAESYNDPVNDPSIKYCGDNLCLEFLGNNKTAIMTISSFNYYPWNNLSVFKTFIDQSFKEINEKGVENLIIDLRFNGGGSAESSIHLLKYLIDEPFNYYANFQFEGKEEKSENEEIQIPFENGYKGKCYYLIDGLGNSTTGHFMSLVKVLNLGTIIGEELGSNQFCSAGQAVCRLSHTKLVYYVANNTAESNATSLPDETGILPDHYVTQSIDDYLNKVDAVKAFTLNLVHK
ncbi:MAG: S41 family peptidase [Saprospiraceae bacterium]